VPDTLISFGVVADLHYGERVRYDRYCRDSLDKLRVAINTFTTRNLPLAVSLGDFIDGMGTRDEELGYLAQASEVFEGIVGRRVHVIGNHDVSATTKTEFLSGVGARPGEAYHSFDYSGVHFVVLDGNCHRDGNDFTPDACPWDDAWLSDEQLAWLDRDLTGAAGPTIVLCHEALCDADPDGLNESYILGNAAEARAIIERRGHVVAVLQGHYHQGAVRITNGIPYVTFAAMVVGPGVESNAFAIVSLLDDGSLTTEGFGRQETFTVKAEATE
jgi:3',5'-cyclic AMP phosphodiesterase CpdA